MSVYEDIKGRVLSEARQIARGRARAGDFLSRVVSLAETFARAHGPSGRVFTACRVVLSRAYGFSEAECRSALAMLERVGFLERVPYDDGGERKAFSPEYRPIRYRLGEGFVRLFPNAVELLARRVRDTTVIGVSLISGQIKSLVSISGEIATKGRAFRDRGVRRATIQALADWKANPPALSFSPRLRAMLGG